MSKALEEIVASMRDMTEGHEAFIKKEATAIEKEVSLAVKKHLLERFKGYKLYVPNAFPKLLKDPIDDSWLTDLDGVYILTNDPEADDFNEEVIDTGVRAIRDAISIEMRQMAKSMKKPNTIPSRIMVIIEAKHNMTVDRVDLKLEQMEHIRAYLERARNLEETTKKFQKNVKQFQFDTYDTNVLMYIGGPHWEERALRHIENVFKKSPLLKESVGLIMPSGSRFGVADSSTAFMMSGGKHQAKKSK